MLQENLHHVHHYIHSILHSVFSRRKLQTKIGVHFWFSSAQHVTVFNRTSLEYILGGGSKNKMYRGSLKLLIVFVLSKNVSARLQKTVHLENQRKFT